MVLEQAALGLAGGAKALWGYNRKNFLYDRHMRQKQEFKIVEYRNVQAALWRQDVRDLVELTERKMDKYLIVNTLQLSMCVVLFTEGRLGPRVPPWLLGLYMLTLGAALAYLFLSILFAVHASVVAQASMVRILTQLVRLPIPTWRELQALRTHASSFEALGARSMLRVPFGGAIVEEDENEERDSKADGKIWGAPCAGPGPAAASEAADRQSSPTAHPSYNVRPITTGSPAPCVPTAVDPWGLERDGSGIDELKRRPPALLRHIDHVRRAAAHFQCYDAFTRVSMLFGTVQSLYAISYFCLGYVGVQEGAMWPACCVAAMMVLVSMTLVHLDLSLTRWEQNISKALLLVGPLSVSYAIFSAGLAGNLNTLRTETRLGLLPPLAFSVHGLWLFWTINVCGVKVQPSGALVPANFRMVVNMDIFGWLGMRRRPDNVAKPNCRGYFAMSKMAVNEFSPSQCPEQLDEACSEPLSDVPASASETLASSLSAAEMPRHVKRCLSPSVQSVMSCPEKLGVQASARRVPSVSSTASTARDEKDSVSSSELSTPTGTSYSGAAASRQTTPSEFSTPISKSVNEKRVESFCQASKGIDVGNSWKSMPLLQGLRGGRQRRTLRFPTPLAWCETKLMPVPHSLVSGDLDDQSDDENVDNNVINALPPAPDHKDPPLAPGHPDAEDRPGSAPWRVFRATTLLLAVLWALGLLVLFGATLGYVDLAVHGGKLGSAHELTGDYLPGGELIMVRWPKRTFAPRALSSDPSGKQVVVADEFGIYASDFGDTFAIDADLSHGGGLVGDTSGERSLRGAMSGETATSFARLPRCVTLEDQALMDVCVVCSQGPRSSCRALVLLGGDTQEFVECPMAVAGGNDLSSTSGFVPGAGGRTGGIFKIAGDWLEEGKEKLESLVFGSKCDGDDSDAKTFMPDRPGCVIVAGTTLGRIVELRLHMENKTQLVPVSTLQQRMEPVGKSSLYIHADSFVMALRPKPGTVQAFELDGGRKLGEWQLPRDVKWLAISGGGDHIYVLGEDPRWRSTIFWRFSVPAELRPLSSTAAPGSVSSSQEI